MTKVLLFANTDWYLYNFRLPLAEKIRSGGMEVVLVSPPGPYVKLLEAKGFRLVHLKMNRRGINPLVEIECIWRLIQIYKKEKPDLVHHFTIKSVLYGTVAAKASGVTSIVNAVAGLGYIFSSSAVYARMLRPLVKVMLRYSLAGASTRLIVQNPDDRNLLIQQGLVRDGQVQIIKGSGVDINRFAPVSDRPVDKVRILLATRLLWDKGVKEFVDAARKFRRTHENVEFLLAGEPDDGNPASVHQKHIKEWSADSVILPLGHVNDMSTLLKTVHIVVLPTSYGEGVPRILLEAAASGLPMVATNVAGCREIVIDGVTGFLVKPKDQSGLENAISKLIENRDIRCNFGEKARIKAVQEFNEVDVIQRTTDVYRDLLEEKLGITSSLPQ